MNELTNPDHLGKPSSLPETEPTTASPHTLKPKCTANLSADRKSIQSDRRLPSVERARTMLARGCGGDHFIDVGLGAQGDERTHPDSPGQRLVLFLGVFFCLCLPPYLCLDLFIPSPHKNAPVQGHTASK